MNSQSSKKSQAADSREEPAGQAERSGDALRSAEAERAETIEQRMERMAARLKEPEAGLAQTGARADHLTADVAGIDNDVRDLRLVKEKMDALNALSEYVKAKVKSLEGQGVVVEKLQVQQVSRELGGGAEDQQRGGANQQQQGSALEQQRREVLKRMWEKLAAAREFLDVRG
jgi:hypothetical protein